eukprot:GILI01020954.1.p1 GENE.GILI01020954.1~~GILI01020954.1.p1  ORF type:complete len:479 (-),score=55.92 GILI01020954.1:122-1558(-)
MAYYDVATYLNDGDLESEVSYPDTDDSREAMRDNFATKAKNIRRKEERRRKAFPPSSAALYKAITDDDEDAVAAILSGPNAPPRFHRSRGSGHNPLHAAAAVGKVAIGRLLLNYLKAQIEDATSVPYTVETVRNQTKIFHTTRHRDGRYSQLRHWVDGKAAGGWTPIGIAIRARKVPFAELLAREAGVSPVAMTRPVAARCYGLPAVTYAMYNAMTGVVASLIENGEADIMALDPDEAVDTLLFCNSHGKSFFGSHNPDNYSSMLHKSLIVIQRWLAEERRAFDEGTTSMSRRNSKLLSENALGHLPLQAAVFRVFTTMPCDYNDDSYMYLVKSTDDDNGQISDAAFLFLASAAVARSIDPPTFKLIISIEDEYFPGTRDGYWLNVLLANALIPGHSYYNTKAEEKRRVECLKIILSLGGDVSRVLFSSTIIKSEMDSNVLLALLDAGMDANQFVSPELDAHQQESLKAITFSDANCY